MISARKTERAGAEDSKIGHGHKKSMACRRAFARQKQWSVEVARCIKEWANGCWDADEVTWKYHRTTEWIRQWRNEPMNQWISESVSELNHWIMKQWNNEATNQWVKNSQKLIESRIFKDSTTRWVKRVGESTKSNERMSEWTNERMKCMTETTRNEIT